jgi:hypothetical protein
MTRGGSDRGMEMRMRWTGHVVCTDEMINGYHNSNMQSANHETHYVLTKSGRKEVRKRIQHVCSLLMPARMPKHDEGGLPQKN